MDFFGKYREEAGKQGFGATRLHLASRERIHASLSSLSKYSSRLEINQAHAFAYSGADRYVLAKDVTRDLLIAIYDVNTSQAILLRPSKAIEGGMARKIASAVGGHKMKNLEMRAIGLQEEDKDLLPGIDMLRKSLKAPLVEVDLFGGDTRHIAFDTKHGMCYDLLLLDRIYKPHELANVEAKEEFEKRRSELKFV